MAERLCHVVAAQPVPVRTGTLAITVSVGLAVGNDPHETLSALLNHADEALYEAKRAGRNRVASG
jgi:diguanylate cyclase (GGDEF)-like protein